MPFLSRGEETPEFGVSGNATVWSQVQTEKGGNVNETILFKRWKL